MLHGLKTGEQIAVVCGLVFIGGFGLWFLVACWGQHWNGRVFRVVFRAASILGLPEDRQRFWLGLSGLAMLVVSLLMLLADIVLLF